MFEFMKNAFFALVGVLCVGTTTAVIMLTINIVVTTLRKMKGWKQHAAGRKE